MVSPSRCLSVADVLHVIAWHHGDVFLQVLLTLFLLLLRININRGRGLKGSQLNLHRVSMGLESN
jgi:hypothetical protein